jgi:hypothetical protein
VVEELVALSQSLQGAGLEVDGLLAPGVLARAIRSAYDPAYLGIWDALDEGARRRGEETPEGPHPNRQWPAMTEEGFLSYRTAPQAWHATFHVAEWPRADVPSDFLAPLLLQGRSMRTVSVVMEPLAPDRAERQVKAAETGEAAAQRVRERGGWLTTWRQRQEQEHMQQVGQELAQGHIGYRFSGYVTVTARTRGELEVACTDVRRMAALAGQLQLEWLAGEQEEAFAYTLPLCRGLDR